MIHTKACCARRKLSTVSDCGYNSLFVAASNTLYAAALTHLMSHISPLLQYSAPPGVSIGANLPADATANEYYTVVMYESTFGAANAAHWGLVNVRAGGW